MKPLLHPLTHLPLFAFVLPLLRLSLVAASGCYYADNSTILSSPSYVDPCGITTSTTSPFLNCCAVQSKNICLSNSLCYDPNQVGGTYYISPCTDQTYSAPECPQYCINRVDTNQLDVTYDSQDQLWRCCGTNSDGSADCSNPTDETFSAPPPNSLSTIYPSTTSSFSSPSSSTAASSSSSSSAQAAADNLAASSTASASLQSLTATTSTAIPLPTKSLSSNNNNGGGQGFDTSDKVAVALALGIGLPGTVATIVGAWYTYVAVRNRRLRQRP